MGGILSSLNTSYTGLKTTQVMVDTTGHNISNANNEFYTRQRVATQSNTPINFGGNYNVGQGTSIQTIERVHDEFVFARYRQSAQEKEYAEFTKDTLEEVSTYYPEIDNVGIYNDVQNYFDAWKDFANNAGDPAQKVVLAQYADTLATNLKDTARRLKDLQGKLYDELKVTVDEINELGAGIAELNKQIKAKERSETNVKANDLRDQRDELEMAMSKLIEVSVFKNNLRASSTTDTRIADFDDEHLINISGYNIVDGKGFHPLVASNDTNAEGFYNVYFETQDHKLRDITADISGGKAGALTDLCLTHTTDCIGQPGKIQNYIDDLNTFAKGLIESTNNIFAESSQFEMVSDPLEVKATDQLTQSNYDIRTGSFDLVVYNVEGEELARKTITIDETTTMNDLVATTSQGINFNDDDNGDNNGLNDFDDEFEATFNEQSGVFQITPKNPSKKLYISVQDNGTNFAGATGLSRFFDGSGGLDIELAQRYQDDPTQLRGYREPIEGNHIVANSMVQLQYDEIKFQNHNGSYVDATIPSFFKMITTRVGTETESAMTLYDTKTSVYNSVQLEYSAISEVNIDEELTNLIRYQTGYSANAKVVTAIDEMISTLLGMKQ